MPLQRVAVDDGSAHVEHLTEVLRSFDWNPFSG